MRKKMAAEAYLADLRRLTLHDGPGTRDTVFLKGCPLHCRWCHNPESISPAPQLLFRNHLCVSCGACVEVCHFHAHKMQGGKHVFLREFCRACGRCETSCLHGALTLCGKKVTPKEIFDEVIKDADFFRLSEGGVTLSGGEPLLFPEFAAQFFRMLHDAGISTALDTCGMVPFSAFEAVLPVTDLLLYDVKGMDAGRHRLNTGSSNELILANLQRLSGEKVSIEIRMPIIPGRNDSEAEIRQAGLFLASNPMVKAIRILPYHVMSQGKYLACGRKNQMQNALPPMPEKLSALAEILRESSGKSVLLY